MGKSQTRAQNKYISKTYDRIALVVPKGRKEEIRLYAASRGESINAFINRLIDEEMSKN